MSWQIRMTTAVLSILLLAAAGCRPAASGSDAGLADGGGDGADEPACPGCWRSALYPEDWSPEFTDSQGRFLHDFSYAGYHNGEQQPPDDPPGVRLDVLDFGADPTGQADSTAAIQQALDRAGEQGGGVVLVPAGLYRCDGLLRVVHSRVVLRGQGAERSRIYFTRAVDLTGRAGLSFQGSPQVELELPLLQDAEPRSFTVTVADAAGLAAGDDVELGAVISEQFVAEHGMTGTWTVSVGQWRAFFRRNVVAVEPAPGGFRVRLDVPVRYPLKVRDSASLRRVSGLLEEVGVEDLGFSNSLSREAALGFDRVHAVQFVHVKDGWLRRLGSFSSPAGEAGYHLQSGGVLVSRSKRVTVSDSTMELAQHRGGGGNGYLFEVMQSSEVLIRDCRGRAGRHNFIQNWDFGTSGCVFLRVRSEDGRMEESGASLTGFSEYHHSLALANLVDSAQSNDGWGAVNRGASSSGAGHCATQNVFWNLRGGIVRSYQYGWGYVIGTSGVEVLADPAADPYGALSGFDLGTEPLDYFEGIDRGTDLRPQSLYEDQLARRLGGG